MESRPLDCGVGSGLTFSAPVWPTQPLAPISRITPSSPKHQAASFFYEDKSNLPPIAYYRLHKIKEYVGVKEKSVKRIHQKYRRHVIEDFYGYWKITSDFRHDDRSRRPSTRKTNKRKTEQAAKRLNVDPSKTNNIHPEYEVPDCMVSNWNDWSHCSKSCGLGEKFRNRTIVRQAKKGGMPCPQLTERSWCGSSRCKPSLINENIDNSSYFKW